MSQTQVIVLGAGAIGRELLTQIVGNQRSAAKLNVCGVVDRSGFVFDANGLSRDAVLALCARKAGGGAVAQATGGRAAAPSASVDAISRGALTRAVVVDATAAETGPLLQTALSRGFDAVLANKLPLSSSQADVDELHAVARTHQRRILYEATVGAGLPVIDTLHKLIDAGDEVLRVEGCPSGTLGFLFGELHAGRTFAEALRDAIAAGYTEPDPRTDLSGLDVARKALILGRQIGFRGDLSAVGVESLVPAHLRDASLAEFLDRLDELNADIIARVERARATGRVLRYRARVTKTEISVGVAEVEASDPLSTLSGTDNQFTFTTSRYSHRQLVITGPGAGAQVTASGVHNDLLRLTERQN
jgi:bifunctional aspartokinase / homoserine dehydrogenase 1